MRLVCLVAVSQRLSGISPCTTETTLPLPTYPPREDSCTQRTYTPSRVVCAAPLALGQELVAAEAAAGGADGPAAMELEAMPPMAAAAQG